MNGQVNRLNPHLIYGEVYSCLLLLVCQFIQISIIHAVKYPTTMPSRIYMNNIIYKKLVKVKENHLLKS